MIFRTLLLLLFVAFIPRAHAAECTRYETIHPLFPLTGAHLSTGKCTSCGLCHINGIWNGTPNTCIGCHNGNPSRQTVYRSASHLPTGVLDCKGCHNTTLFNSLTGITAVMIHNTAAAMRCDSCHNGAYTSYGARGKSNDHPKTATVNGVKITVATVDCNICHSTRNWDPLPGVRN
jgi:hypothetical protein